MGNSIGKHLGTRVIASLLGLAGLNYMALSVIPFFGAATIGMLLFGYLLLLLLISGVIFTYDISRVIDWKKTGIFVGSAMSFMLALCSFVYCHGTTDMTMLLSKYAISQRTVTNSVVTSEIQKYSKNSPASLFLKQFLMTCPNSSLLAWNNVKLRAQYLDALYTKKVLPENATVPSFGFLHVTKDVATEIPVKNSERYQDKGLHYFYAHRKSGFTVDHVNTINREITRVVMNNGGIMPLYNVYAKISFRN